MEYKDSISRFERLLVHFCLIDTLFLTYMPFLALSFSVPLSILWFVNCIRQKSYPRDAEWNRYLLFVFFVTISSFFAWLFVFDGFEQAVKTNIEFILTFNLFFIFKKYLKYVKVDKFLCCLLYFGAFLALIYFADRSFFLQLKHLINPYDGDSLTYYYGINPITQFRFNYLWTDANNPAYMFSAVLFLLYSITEYSLLKKTILYLCTGFVVIATMSKGGLITFISVSVIYFVSRKRRFSFVVKKKDFFAIVLIVIMLVLFIPTIGNFFTTNETILQSFDRIQNNTSGSASRIQIWLDFLESKPLIKYILFGEGPIHIINGRFLQPHNGFLYLIYGYGMIGTILFTRLVLIPKNKIWRCPYYFPILFGFFVNTLITNPKILGILFVVRICSDPCFSYIGDTRGNSR